MLAPKVKEIMTTAVFTVGKYTPIYEALQLFSEHGVSGLPVVDDDMTLVAMLSEKDILRLVFLPEEEWDKTVSDFMTQPALFFDQDESLLDVCNFLRKNVFRRVPIVSNGKLVGVISIRDIIGFMVGQKSQTPMTASMLEQ